MKMDMIDLGVVYTHDNGRTLELAGDQAEGEWFAYEADGTCFAQGFYQEDEEGEGTFFQDDAGLDMNTDLPVGPDELEGFIQAILEGHHQHA